MRKLLPFILSSCISIAGCNTSKIEPRPPENILIMDKNPAMKNDLETLTVKIFLDEEIKTEEIPSIHNRTEESLSFIKETARKSGRLKGKDFKFKVEIGGYWDSTDAYDDCEDLLNEFKEESKSDADIALVYTGQKTRECVGYADNIPGRLALISSNVMPIKLKSIIVHELGHSFGLYHNNKPERMMYPNAIKGPGIFSEKEAVVLADNILSFLNFKEISLALPKKPSLRRLFDFPLAGVKKGIPDYYIDTFSSLGIPGCRARASIKASGSFNIEVEHPLKKKSACNIPEMKDALGEAPKEDIVYYKELPVIGKKIEEYNVSIVLNISPAYFMQHYPEVLDLAVKYKFLDPIKADIVHETMDLAKKLETNPFIIFYNLD